MVSLPGLAKHLMLVMRNEFGMIPSLSALWNTWRMFFKDLGELVRDSLVVSFPMLRDSSKLFLSIDFFGVSYALGLVWKVMYFLFTGMLLFTLFPTEPLGFHRICSI